LGVFIEGLYYLLYNHIIGEHYMGYHWIGQTGNRVRTPTEKRCRDLPSRSVRPSMATPGF
jgi:hypothetical protein